MPERRREGEVPGAAVIYSQAAPAGFHVVTARRR
jgi:hypothetical protein